MGSPMVFHTNPPQPASKARCACPTVFDGGPDATQKGLGDLMPAKLTDRLAISCSFRPMIRLKFRDADGPVETGSLRRARDAQARWLERAGDFFTGQEIMDAASGAFAFRDCVD